MTGPEDARGAVGGRRAGDRIRRPAQTLVGCLVISCAIVIALVAGLVGLYGITAFGFHYESTIKTLAAELDPGRVNGELQVDGCTGQEFTTTRGITFTTVYTCAGAFLPASGAAPVRDVALVNDMRAYLPGSRVAVAVLPERHEAYVAGLRGFLIALAALWLPVGVFFAALLVRSFRSRVAWFGIGAVVVLGIASALAVLWP